MARPFLAPSGPVPVNGFNHSANRTTAPALEPRLDDRYAMGARDMALYLGVSVDRIREWIADGSLPAKRNGTALVIKRTDGEARVDALPDATSTP